MTPPREQTAVARPAPLDLSVVIPVYREADSLRTLLPSLEQALGGLGVAYEILIVDTIRPLDDAPAICAGRPGVRYLNRSGGDRYGDAIRTGIAATAGEWVVLMDGDGSHNPAFLAEMWPWRREHDLVIASRYVAGGKTENPAVLIFLSLLVNITFRLVLGLNCLDVSNSFRLYRGDQLRMLKLVCHHFDIVEEILVRLANAPVGCRIKEIPCVFERRKAGRTKRNLVTFAIGYGFTLVRLVNLTFRAQK